MKIYLHHDLFRSDGAKPPKPPEPPKVGSAGPAAQPPSTSPSPSGKVGGLGGGGAGTEYDYWYPSAGQTSPPGQGWEPLQGSAGYKRPKGMGGASPTMSPTFAVSPAAVAAAIKKLPKDAANQPLPPRMPPKGDPDLSVFPQGPFIPPKEKKQAAPWLKPDAHPTLPEPLAPQEAQKKPTFAVSPAAVAAAIKKLPKDAANQPLPPRMPPKGDPDLSVFPQGPFIPPKEKTGKPAYSEKTAQQLSGPHANSDATTHEKMAEEHKKMGNEEHAAWHAEQAQKKAAPKKEKKTSVADIEHMSHTDQAKTLADAVRSHAQNPNLLEGSKKIAEHLATALEYHANLTRHSPEASKELSKLKQIARAHGLHKPFGGAGLEQVGGDATDPSNDPLNLLGDFHKYRAYGQGVGASAASAYGAGHVGSQLANYASTEAVHAGHKLLNADAKDQYSDKQTTTAAMAAAEREARSASKADNPALRKFK